jgi:hypothetical protein
LFVVNRRQIRQARISKSQIASSSTDAKEMFACIFHATPAHRPRGDPFCGPVSTIWSGTGAKNSRDKLEILSNQGESNVQGQLFEVSDSVRPNY